MNPRIAGPVAVLLTSSVLLAGCGGDDKPQRSGSTPSTTSSASSSATPTPSAQEGTAEDARPVVEAVATALRTAGSVRVDASLAGGPARELTVDTTPIADALGKVALPQQLVHVGAEQVDGVATEHYRITLDPRAALAGITLPAQVQAMLPDTLDADVWLDAQDRPVKVTAEPGVELRFSDWGVSAP